MMLHVLLVACCLRLLIVDLRHMSAKSPRPTGKTAKPQLHIEN